MNAIDTLLDKMVSQAANTVGPSWNPGFMPEKGDTFELDGREWLALNDSGLCWPLDQDPA